jgi:hypothetical protein
VPLFWARLALLYAYTGATLGDDFTLGDSCTLGDAASFFVLYTVLSCWSAYVAVAMLCASVVQTSGWLNKCVNASAAMMAASGADKDGVLYSLGNNSTVSETCSACVVVT